MSNKNKKKSAEKIDYKSDDKSNDKSNDKSDNKNKHNNDDNHTIDNDTKNLVQEKKTTLIASNLHNPSTNTTLVCPIMLYPNQMDNKMHIHIKSNLINKLEKKCYKNYGYINKIFSIELHKLFSSKSKFISNSNSLILFGKLSIIYLLLQSNFKFIIAFDKLNC